MKNILDFQLDIVLNNSRRECHKIAGFQAICLIEMSGVTRPPQVVQQCMCLWGYMIAELGHTKKPAQQLGPRD